MAKYRLLTKEELEQFEEEFREYLAVNGIDAAEWKRLKAEELEKAEKITDLFSDVVFEKIMREVRFLTFRSKTQLFCFQCLPTEVVLVGMQGEEADGVDFSNEKFMEQARTNPPMSLKVFTQSKKYKGQRELEIFNMIENGCEIDDGQLFKTVSMAL